MKFVSIGVSINYFMDFEFVSIGVSINYFMDFHIEKHSTHEAWKTSLIVKIT